MTIEDITTAQRVHGFAALLLKRLNDFNEGLTSGEEFHDAIELLNETYPPQLDDDPHGLHLQAMAYEELGLDQEAISAYSEAAVQLSIIGDSVREAAAYMALSLLYFRNENLRAAGWAANQAAFLYVHLGDTPRHTALRLYLFCLYPTCDPVWVGAHRLLRIMKSLGAYGRDARTLYTLE